MSYIQRLNHLRAFSQELNVNAIFITTPANLSYFSGFIPLDVTDREAYILVTKTNAYIFTSALYIDEVKTYVSDYTIIEITADLPFHKRLAAIIKKENIMTIGFEEHNLTFSEHDRLKKEAIKLLPTTINHLRVKKDTQEIAYIRRACEIGDQAFSSVLGLIKPGITEEDLAFELELFMRKHKTIPSFPTIVGFGPHAAIPHHVTGTTPLSKNQFILMDFGVKYQNYCSDMTRTVFIGTPSLEQKKLYDAVLNSQQVAIDYIEKQYREQKPIKASKADALSREILEKKGFSSFPHSLGHGIGIQVHERPSLSPYSSDLLETGMVFSVEPGIYQQNHVGIRIEDLVVLDKKNATMLTQSSRKLISL